MPIVQKFRRWFFSSLTILSLFVSHPTFAAQVCKASDRQLLSAMGLVQEKQKNIGMQVAIHLGSRMAFSKAIGVKDIESKELVTRDTLFPVASVTKAFTGIATLKAHAAGKIKLDDPIQTYVPGFPVKPELVITPRRLAAHFAGIRHWGPERDALYARHFDRLQEILPLFENDPLLPKAGTTYQYSSYGYNLLALGVERATGVEFTTFVRREIIEPLGLSQTRFDDARKPASGMTKLYSYYDLKTYADIPNPVTVPPLDYSHNAAAGNMSSTAEDLAKLGIALLRPGFLPRAEYELLLERPKFPQGESKMSFGFFVSEQRQERRLSISGANPGVQAGLMIFPERNLVVAVLSNTWGVGSRSAEMTSDLPQRLADFCAPAGK